MSFYCLYSQGDSRRHIEKDGIRVATFQNGEKKVSDDGSILTQKDILTILNSLTKEQKEIAQKIQKFMATVGAEWGNYVSVARFGEKLFGMAYADFTISYILDNEKKMYVTAVDWS